MLSARQWAPSACNTLQKLELCPFSRFLIWNMIVYPAWTPILLSDILKVFLKNEVLNTLNLEPRISGWIKYQKCFIHSEVNEIVINSCIVNKLMVFPSSPGSALISQYTTLGKKVFSMLKLSVSSGCNLKKIFESANGCTLVWRNDEQQPSNMEVFCLWCLVLWHNGILELSRSFGICLQSRWSSSTGKHACLLQHCGN